MDVTGRAHKGLLTGADLASWHASAEPPVTLNFHGLTVCKTGPWGQGPVFLQQLALLSGFDLAAMDPGSADFVHAVIESSKLAFADREAWYGDPDFVNVPLDELLSPEYNDKRRALIGDVASADLVPGSPGGRAPLMPGFATGAFGKEGRGRTGDPGLDPATGEPLGRAPHAQARRGDTCPLDLLPPWANMVPPTPSAR